MNDIILLIAFFTIFSFIIFYGFKKISAKSIKNVPAILQVKKHLGKNFTENLKDITIEPYGCFSNLKDKFFLKSINPYSKNKQFDSGIIISDHSVKNDLRRLIKNVLKNGYDLYGNKLLKKYKTNYDYENMPIKEIATLAKLSGYNYISIYKTGLHSKGNVYLTYSPPMKTSVTDIYNNFNSEQYQELLEKSDLLDYKLTPELNENSLKCGYPCLPFNKPSTFKDSNGKIRQYMCGSISYPTIKTPPRYAVYKITEIE